MVYRVIKFRATNDAHIGLFWGPRRTDAGAVDTSSEFYEIVLGGWGNTKSVIRETSQGPNQVEVGGAVCAGMDTWVTVTVAFTGGNTVVVYMGDIPGENVFMQWTDPTPKKVNHVAVMTGWGGEGYWEFAKVENPFVVKHTYSVDTDSCLQAREGWGESYTCANS